MGKGDSSWRRQDAWRGGSLIGGGQFMPETFKQKSALRIPL
jgi:hypothetical protein